MSQFLICKSEEDMSMFGKKVAKVSTNKDIFEKVISAYLKEADINNVWVISNIHEIVNSLEENMELLKNIGQKAEVMIFWYGIDYDELDEVRSRQELMQYFKNNIKTPCLELYLLCEFA